MKKRIFIAVFILLMLTVPSVTAFANDGDRGLAITVIVPSPEEQQAEQVVQVTQSPIIYHVYPVHVWESRENGRRELIRVYELRNNESPAQIPREPFERDGFRFELAEIVRREIPVHSTQDHVETVEISTQTNDLESVIRLLSPTMEYLRDDGYFGVLTLDISSIRIASQGTTSSSFTTTRTREFPHLSSPDTSLVPRTITENGVTYNLANVEWRSQATTSIDYRQVPTTFTAVATYSRVGTRTATIGYTTTAEFRGEISRITVGRMEFTAHFIGIPIVMPTVAVEQTACDEATENNEVETAMPATPQASPVIENVTVEQVHIGGIVIEKEQMPPVQEYISAYRDDIAEDSDEDNEPSSFPIGNIFIGLLFIGGLVLAYFVGKKGEVMLGAMKKISCILLVCGLMLGALQTVYAAELPTYGFGVRNSEPAVHMNTKGTGHGTQHSSSSFSNAETVHFHPNAGVTKQQHSGNAIHFAPNRASPVTITPAGYVYGEIIGVLTVERLGRSINVIAGATMEAMDFGAGHFSFTGLNQGNTGLIGHNRGRINGFFDFVRHLREGDILTLEAGGIIRSYAVTMLYTIDYTDFSPLAQFGDHRLSLITCVEYQRNRRRVAIAIEIV